MFSDENFSLPNLQTVLADGGYTDETFAQAINEIRNILCDVFCYISFSATSLVENTKLFCL